VEVVLEVFLVPLEARNTLFVGRNHTAVLRLNQGHRQIFVAVEHLNADVVVEELVVVFKDLVGFLEVGSELDWASLRELAEGVNS